MLESFSIEENLWGRHECLRHSSRYVVAMTVTVGDKQIAESDGLRPRVQKQRTRRHLPPRRVRRRAPHADRETQLLADVQAGGALGTPGLALRGLPFVAIIAAIIVISPLGMGPHDHVQVAWTFIAAAAIVAMAWWFPWQRVDVRWQVVVPFAIISVNPFLRDATGGADSGVSLLMLPMLWIALYHSRTAILFGVLAVAATYALPPILLQSGYPDVGIELRRAVTTAVLYATMALIIQRLMAQLQRGRQRMEVSNKALETAYERERAMVEQLTELDRLKSRFIAVASHELRTPLTSITGFTRTIVERWDYLDDAEKRHFIGVVDQQGDRLARLVDDLLVLSRIQSETIETQPQDLTLQTVIEEVIAGLDIANIDVEGDKDVEVYADELHLQRILVNFLTNAIKYGSDPLTICIQPVGSEWVDVRVCDTGPGVDPRFAPRLFQEFERDERHEHAGVPGTGLGLSIVQGLARAQGGKTWHEHNKPSGAIFVLRLPAANRTLQSTGR